MESTSHAPTHSVTVVGVFADQPQADRAIAELQRAGFTDEQIGFVARSAGESIAAVPATTTVETDSQKGEGAVGGMLAGAGVGALIAAGVSLLIPGVGPILAGGILAASLGGAAVGAAAGGVMGGLIGAGVPEVEAREYEREFNEGRALVLVRADQRAGEARDILRRAGGVIEAGPAAAA